MLVLAPGKANGQGVLAGAGGEGSNPSCLNLVSIDSSGGRLGVSLGWFILLAVSSP